MFVAVHDVRNPNGERSRNIDAYMAILDKNSISHALTSVNDPNFWEVIHEADLFIYRFNHFDSNRQLARDLIPVLDQIRGLNCFPTAEETWHYDDKIRQAMLAQSHGWPMVQSWFFYSKDSAIKWAQDADYPVVFKLKGGAGSQNVLLVKSSAQAITLIKKMFGSGVFPGRFDADGSLRKTTASFKAALRRVGGRLYRSSKGLDADPYWALHKNYVLFQRYLPNNDCDTRITVIGGRAFGFRRLVRNNDFRASGSGMITYDPERIDKRCVEMAFRVSQEGGYRSMAYDFLYNSDGEPEFCEMSYDYSSSNVEQCPGYWDNDLSWVPGNFCPELLHLQDALSRYDLVA